MPNQLARRALPGGRRAPDLCKPSGFQGTRLERVHYLTQHESVDGPRWALDRRRLADDVTLARPLRLPPGDLVRITIGELSLGNEVSPSTPLGTGA